MKTINVKITEKDLQKYDLKIDVISFSDLLEKIKIEFAKETLHRTHIESDKSGLSKMNMNEIDAEVNDYRKTKNNSRY